MLLAVLLVVIGLVKKQGARYWLAALGAVLFQVVVSYLFQYHTGIVTPYVKRATHDGKLMEVYAMVFVALSWGVPAFVARCGYRRKRPLPAPSSVP
ncbi:MAG TPA: hypothetical protein VHO06_19240 [Polyangia bacterium]|nr:hypothetical protein [Polyangia bacterium]